MKALEDLIVDKLADMINYVLARTIQPDITIDRVRELNAEMIAKLKAHYGIEGIILDVDETLRKNMGRIPRCNEEWLESLRGQLKVIILSNGIDRNIDAFFKKRGIDYICFANKPLKRNFIRACKKMDLEPSKVLMVGNSLYCDIHGGKRNKMRTALVRGVEDDER